MRRKELELKDRASIEKIIASANTIRLGVIADDMPYIVPFVYGYEWNNEFPVFYMPGGMAGRKGQGIYDGAKVCFEIDIEGPLMTSRTNYANNFSKEFCCIMGEGILHFAEDAENKIEYFSHIMKKMTGKNDYDYQSGWLAMTNVFRLVPYKLSASQKGMDNGAKNEKAENFDWDRESKTADGAIFWD